MRNKTPLLGRFMLRLDGIVAIKGMTTLISKGGQKPLLFTLHGDIMEMRQLIPGWNGGDGALQQEQVHPVYLLGFAAS